MAIIRLGKTREATEFTAEKHKAAIRKYMEATGYAQLTDSRLEGHLPDMVFRALGNAPWPEVWAESKATELSLSAPRLAEEIRSYLREWLSRKSESRFKFMLFARKLVNVSRWDAIWGNNLSQSDSLDWLTGDLDEPSASYFVEPNRVKEVMSFFSEASIVEGNDVDLTDMAEEKRKVALSANEVRQRALRQLGLMDQRSRPIPKKSGLIGNLLHFTAPSSYAILGINPVSSLEIRNLMRRRDSPPYCILEAGELLTLNHENAEASFAILNPTLVRTLNLAELQATYPRLLAQLVNHAISKVLKLLGVGFFNGRSFFLAGREAKERKPRVLQIPSGATMQVAKPYSSRPKGNGLGTDSTEKLNFVFHQAFSLRYRNLWDQHFIEFRLGKLYTEDGVIAIGGNRAARLDARFRNPAFDRSETRQMKLEKISQYVFHGGVRNYPNWIGMFRFHGFLKIPTNWTPDAVPLDQAMMDDFGQDAGGQDY